MPEYTKNLNLVKPPQNGFYDIEEFNDNSDILDGELAALGEQLDDHTRTHVYLQAEEPTDFTPTTRWFESLGAVDWEL